MRSNLGHFLKCNEPTYMAIVDICMVLGNASYFFAPQQWSPSLLVVLHVLTTQEWTQMPRAWDHKVHRDSSCCRLLTSFRNLKPHIQITQSTIWLRVQHSLTKEGKIITISCRTKWVLSKWNRMFGTLISIVLAPCMYCMLWMLLSLCWCTETHVVIWFHHSYQFLLNNITGRYEEVSASHSCSCLDEGWLFRGNSNVKCAKANTFMASKGQINDEHMVKATQMGNGKHEKGISVLWNENDIGVPGGIRPRC